MKTIDKCTLTVFHLTEEKWGECWCAGRSSNASRMDAKNEEVFGSLSVDFEAHGENDFDQNADISEMNQNPMYLTQGTATTCMSIDCVVFHFAFVLIVNRHHFQMLFVIIPCSQHEWTSDKKKTVRIIVFVYLLEISNYFVDFSCISEEDS